MGSVGGSGQERLVGPDCPMKMGYIGLRRIYSRSVMLKENLALLPASAYI